MGEVSKGGREGEIVPTRGAVEHAQLGQAVVLCVGGGEGVDVFDGLEEGLAGHLRKREGEKECE